MFKRIKNRFSDIKTISALISGADKEANLQGEEEPGAEHFLLSAFNLADGSALRVFDRVGIAAGADAFRQAIKQQYEDALAGIGIDQEIAEIEPEPIAEPKGLHNAKPSGRALMSSLYELKKADQGRPLLGAHVVQVAADMEFGVVARALKQLGIQGSQLKEAAKDEIASGKYD